MSENEQQSVENGISEFKHFVKDTYCTKLQWNQLEQYCALLTDINTKINLVSRKDIHKLWEHHIIPSLAFVLLNRIRSNEYVLDIGSGGGLPGIINAIMFPSSEFLLVDSTRKKVTALSEMITALELPNVTAKWIRIEELAEDVALQHCFDRTTSRAVAPLKKLVKWSIPFLKPGGTVEALKGGSLTEELKHFNTSFSYPTTQHHIPQDMIVGSNSPLPERLSSAVICTVEIA